MGYRPEPTIYTLRYEKFPGLEVVAKAISVQGFTELIKLAGSATHLQSKSPDDITAEDLAGVEQLFRRFASRLVQWNVENEDGSPVPATYDGVTSQEVPFLLQVIEGWMESMGAPADPKASASGGSTATHPAMEASLLAASSSLSPGS